MKETRMPAEWEAHDALWLAMPHDEKEWGDAFEAARLSVQELIAELQSDQGCERIELLVPEPGSMPPHARRREHRVDYGDIWLRDTGPIFVHSGQELAALGFDFNGWGGKYVFPHDEEVAATIAGLAQAPLQHQPWTLEGGAIESNGAGTFLSTRECLLNPNRNPGMSESQVEQALEAALGARKVIWLDRGLRGDHTDGHIDNLARFVSHSRVVCMRPSTDADPNAEILREIHAQLLRARTVEGQPLECVEIPSPGAVTGPDGLMAASYCNFLITNCCVVVPTFGVAADSEALSVFGDLFPGRRIVGLDACALLTGGGTVHCISREQPIPPPHV
jgi:agmatine deiminase